MTPLADQGDFVVPAASTGPVGLVVKMRNLLMRAGRVVLEFARVSPIGAAAAVGLLLLCLVAIFADQIAPYDPVFANLLHTRTPPSQAHLMGTDELGRDVLSRIIHGTRVSLFVGFASVLLGDSIGLAWGIISGYVGGKLDLFTQRLLDVALSFPTIILAMLLLVGFGAGMWTIIGAIAITMIPRASRIIRSQVLAVKEKAFVEAARSIGASDLRIMLREIRPETMGPFLVVVTANFGVAIVVEASLSFLGLGIPPPQPSWGGMLGGSLAETFRPMWWLVLFPGLFLSMTVLAANLFGDGVRDYLDPRIRARR